VESKNVLSNSARSAEFPVYYILSLFFDYFFESLKKQKW
jgi:hypothetical protein